jgi:hypothetical protein
MLNPNQVKKHHIKNDDFADIAILKRKERLTSATTAATASTGILGKETSHEAINHDHENSPS